MQNKLTQFIRISWNNINRRTINGSYPDWNNPGTRLYLLKGRELHFTRDVFRDWVLARKNVVTRMWNAGDHPSINRIDRDGHYEINNISLTTVRRNKLEGSHVNKRNAAKRMLRNRKCPACKTKLVKYEGEPTTRFNVRKHCNSACYRGVKRD